MSMKPIISPVSRELIMSELKSEYLLRTTNKADNELYVITAKECPNIMQEIGRLREMAFRGAGGGTGESVDIDELDLVEGGYKQLFVWDPVSQEIMGGYRYTICDGENPKHLSTEHYFEFSDSFRKEILPYTMELGRSFVNSSHLSDGVNPKILFALDNLWNGLGALIVNNPDKLYFLGKVTMYGHYNVEARNILLHFLHIYFPDKSEYLKPLFPIALNIDTTRIGDFFVGNDYKDDLKTLNGKLRELGEFIPPMIYSYMKVSPTMQVFSTVVNPDFGGVEETAILVPIKEMHVSKIERHTSGIAKIDAKLQKLKPYSNFRRILIEKITLRKLKKLKNK